MSILQEQLGEEDVAAFLTIPGERLIWASRKHSIHVGISIGITTVGLFSLAAALFTIFSYFEVSWSIFLLTGMLAAILGLSHTIKTIIDWYCHIYIVTNFKILEVSSSPMFSHKSHEVLLSQVRVSEINVVIHNFIEELWNVGSVTIEFDRLAHIEVLEISGVRGAREVGNILSTALEGTYPAPSARIAGSLFVKPKEVARL
jgi:hypothetical protein